MRLWCCIALICLFAMAAGGAQPGPSNALVLTDDVLAAARALEARGGQAYHLFDGALLGYVPPALQGVEKGIGQVVRGPVAPAAVAGRGRGVEAAVAIWNRTLGVGAREPAPPRDRQPAPLVNDIRRVPPRPLTLGMRAAAPIGTDRYHTSEYMLGRIAVGIWLPESTGNGENWSSTRQNTVVAKIQEACEWWRLRWPTANLSFVYDLHLGVPVSVEPIQNSSMNEGVWINQCLATLGYTDTDYFENVYSYNDALRQSTHADWVLSVWVVDSLNDSDGIFPDGYFAYSYLGGPFMVMTYDNDGYGISYMNAVMAHELGHIFWALDEYAGALDGTGQPITASDCSGYLNVANGNFETGGVTDVPCIMRGQVEPYDDPAVCSYTRGQVGMRDSDSDGIPDILDVAPECVLTAYSPDPAATYTLSYTGNARVGLLENLNSQDTPPLLDSSTNTLAAAEYRVDGGSWQQAAPADGAFDEGLEGFTFTVILGNGTHTIQARAKDRYGVYSLPSSDTVTVSSNWPAPPGNLAASVPSTSQVVLTWSDVATNETGYLVDRQAAGTSTWVPLATLGPNATTFTDISASLGAYTYRVGATNSAGTSYSQIPVEVRTFADVPVTASYWAYVEAVVREGITSGCSTTPRLYCPLSPVTRGQMAVFLCRAAGLAPYYKEVPTFADVPKDSSQYPYVEAIYRAGITGGCATNPLRYCPAATVTRGQMAVFLCRAAGIAPYNKPTPTFADVPATSSQYPYVEGIYQAGVTSGCGTNPLRYCPGASITRGQMAVFLCRAFEIPLP